MCTRERQRGTIRRRSSSILQTMSQPDLTKDEFTLSVVVPCYNEERTLRRCVERVRGIADDNLGVEIVIVDDCSSDNSPTVAEELAQTYPEVVFLRHETNVGKGGALRTGFARAGGDFVAVQDADLEYDPTDLRRLVEPLRAGNADVVLGSRFLPHGMHRVLYFWHSLGNRFLTFLSNMLTDLNVTDMETCYKVFRREVIQGIELQENGFGFEPEIVAKVAHMRLRIYEMGISYHGRTYAEGKKIGVKDGLRALYCIVKYNMSTAPWLLQLAGYVLVGGTAAVVDLVVFLGLLNAGAPVTAAAPVAFVIAAFVNYFLCISVLFRHRARWTAAGELIVFFMVVAAVGAMDLAVTMALLAAGYPPAVAKLVATALGFAINFAGRRFLVFPEPSRPDWRPLFEHGEE